MLGKINATLKTGAEPFMTNDAPLGFTVLDFWRWSSSDLVGNALRGHVAEFLVARAVGAAAAIRNEWDAFDVMTQSGLRIEVKSAAYLQSWAQRVESSISFDIRETLAWDADTNVFSSESERRRQAHLYVFALLAHRDKATLNPLEVSQWAFYPFRASVLNEHLKAQRRISLSRLEQLGAARCSYRVLRRRVDELEPASVMLPDSAR